MATATTHSQKGINPFGAGAIGTALGVAIGATTVVLTDKQNRRKVLKTVGGITKQTIDLYTEGRKIITLGKKIKSRKVALKH